MKKILVFTVVDQGYDVDHSIQTNLLTCYHINEDQWSQLINNFNHPIIKNKVDKLNYYGFDWVFIRENDQIYEIKLDRILDYKQLHFDLLKITNQEDILFNQYIRFENYFNDHYLKTDPVHCLWNNISTFIQNCELTSQNLNYLKLINNLNVKNDLFSVKKWNIGIINYQSDTLLPSFFTKNVKIKYIKNYENIIDQNINDYEKISDLKLSKSFS